MSKTVTFSFGTKYQVPREIETFTFEEIGINEDFDIHNTMHKKIIEEIFQSWVWDKLNISYSIIIEEKNGYLDRKD